MADNKKLAQDILQAVGGKENVTSVTHCMTRLRFVLKDETAIKEDEIKNIPTLMGAVHSGGQYQVIVGQSVPKVYAELCSIGGFAAQEAINENLDAGPRKITIKGIGSAIMAYLAGSMTPLIPAMIVAALFRTLQALLGPDLLGVLAADSDLYILCDMAYNAFFYFLPVYVGYTAARQLGASTVLGIFSAGILLVPQFTALADAGSSFSVYGIPAPVAVYSQTLLPIILTVAAMSFIERFFRKIIPDMFSTVFVPFCTIAVLLPLEFCLLAPLGTYLSNVVGAILGAFTQYGGFIGVAIVAALWEFLVMSGMHVVLINLGLVNMMSTGVDYGIFIGGNIATWAAYGIALGAFLRLRKKDEKSLAMGYFLSGIVGGVTEPALYGIGFKYKRPFIPMMIGGFVGGAYAAIMHVGCYIIGSANFLAIMGFVPGGMANTVNAVIGGLLAMGVSAACTFLFGFSKEDLAA